MENNQLQRTTGSSVGFVEKMLDSIETFEKAKEFGQFIISSGYAPKHFTSPESVVLAIDAGKKIGFDWFQSLQEGYIVNGIPGYKGKALKALVLASSVCESWETSFIGSLKDETLTCVITYKRRGTASQTREYSVDMAKQAKLWGPKTKYDQYKKTNVTYEDTWCKFPADMLEWKCVARVLNDFADITKGFRPIEDLQDYEIEQKPFVIDGGITVDTKKEEIIHNTNAKVAEVVDSKERKKKSLAGATTPTVKIEPTPEQPKEEPIQEAVVVESEQPKPEAEVKNDLPFEVSGEEKTPLVDISAAQDAYLERLKKLQPKQVADEFIGLHKSGKLKFGTDLWLKAGGSKIVKDLIIMLDAANRGEDQLLVALKNLGVKAEILFAAQPRSMDEQLVIMDAIVATGNDPELIAKELGYASAEAMYPSVDVTKIEAIIGTLIPFA